MDLEQALAQVVGRSHVLSDPELTAGYERDWTGRFSGRARLVVRPVDAAQVAGVMETCAGEGVAVVPQGDNTGLVGASVPRDGVSRLSGLTKDNAGYDLPALRIGSEGTLAIITRVASAGNG